MKLIIDIDEDAYKEIKKIVADGNDMFFTDKLIANGTPFDSVIGDIKKERYNQGFVDGYKNSYDRGHAVIEDIKTEIEELKSCCDDDWDAFLVGRKEAYNNVLQIIDKHIGKAESEDT